MPQTQITFKDGKKFIVLHKKEFTEEELERLKSLTSDQFKELLFEAGSFVKVPHKK